MTPKPEVWISEVMQPFLIMEDIGQDGSNAIE